jgi:hypothetical protein
VKQLLLTISAGKRLIGKALAVHPEIRNNLTKGTIVIIAGTTNGYIAEEILASIGETRSFTKERFFRGITLAPNYQVSKTGRFTDESGFPGDVVIQNGVWLKGKTINDVAVDLKEGDIVLKGANALDLANKRAAILIGNPNGGTTIPILQALIGQRIRLILPVGLEKRIPGNLDELANKINSPGNKGWRLIPVPGEVFTEIEALDQLSGAKCEIFAAGGICGAEGSVWLLINGTPDQEYMAENILKSIAREPAFSID